MKQGLLLWSPCPLFLSQPTILHRLTKPITFTVTVTATLESSVNEKPLTAKERRQIRNERRESKPAYNWKEEVEEKLIIKPKKRYQSWTEELNLDNLALTGPEWWAVRVSRVIGHETAQTLARAMVRNFPELDFKVYAPSVHVKKKLKNGTISIKPKPLFPGCIFVRCLMNKEMHDFIRECNGVGGFIGSKVGNTKRQINLPRAVDSADMEAIFKQAKEEQEKADQEFEKEELESKKLTALDISEPVKTKGRPKKSQKLVANGPSEGPDEKLLKTGLTVRVISGSFAGFSGILKKFDTKKRLETVGFSLFGKETLADLDVNQIVVEETK